jgi:filamentous hemagglutinin family protein
MRRAFFGTVVVLLNTIALSESATAQVVSDNTVKTTINLNGMAVEINNGARSGNNLFHSFSQFSVPTHGSVIFNNATDVQNIFSRVTGSQISNIDGILKTQGTANLFLMNPNGIIFGPNARLEIGGSFVGTTASSVKFGDGLEFNTVNSTPVLLSVNVPIGLQMGASSGAIEVFGNGHTLNQPLAPGAVIGAGKSRQGLSVAPSHTLALIGSTIQLSGGVVSAPQGRIEVGSVGAGWVGLQPASEGWRLDYGGIQDWRDIQLTKLSLLDASGMGQGNIQVVGRQISLSEGSSILIQNQDTQAANQIRIQASVSLQLQKSAPNNFFSGIISETIATGKGASIELIAPQLTLQNHAKILSLSHGAGYGGDLSIVSTQILVDGQFDRLSGIGTIIMNTASGSGQMGNTTISTQQLQVLNGGLITASTRGTGNGRELTIKASEFIEVNGVNRSSTGEPSLITSSSLGQGNAGNLTFYTPRLFLRNSGMVAVSALAQGNAGNLFLYVDDTIEVNGKVNGFNPSNIDSSALILLPQVRAALGLPDRPSGNSGSIEIITQALNLTDGGSILARNEGLGNAGSIAIRTNTLQLDRQAKILASSASGQGGGITLENRSALILRNSSEISTSSKGGGNGGNILIKSPIIVGLKNSDIIANAEKGQGGKIRITTQGLLGLKYRDRLTLDNDITASSEFGINGNVQVNTIGINPTNTLNALPINVVDSSTQITDQCGAAKTSSFVATGRGGMPRNPMKTRSSDRSWHDLRSLTTINVAAPVAIVNPIQPLIEASAFHVDESGAISLVAPNPSDLPSTATCGMSSSH